MDFAGPAVNPATGRPIEEKDAEAQAAQDARELEKLRSETAWHGASDSAHGQMLVKMLEQELVTAFERFLQTDAAGKLVVNLLRSLGVKEGQAKRAVDEIIKFEFERRKAGHTGQRTTRDPATRWG